MAKVKYYYDPRTLSYRKIERTWKDKLRNTGVFLASAFLFGVLLFFAADNIIDSPKEKRLKRDLSNMELQYEDLNRRMEELADVLDDIEYRDDNIYRVVFEAEPVPKEVRNSGFGGANRYEALEGYSHSDLLIQTTAELDQLTKRLVVQSRSFDEVMELARDKESLLAAIPAIQPVSNQDLRRIASGFGYRIHPIYKVRKLHTGLDFSAPTGTPIYATGDGKVTVARTRNGSGYGRYVQIDHGFGYETLYGHMNRVVVRRGQEVKRGDIIGYVGNSGRSTAPHLHYEVIRNGSKINPINFFYNDLSPEEYDELIEISSRSNQSFD
ncbi:MAG: M23 family metallopeptidase [Bacteroidetes bacterium]|uniref:M23 family metallopeptidase n=1 Tax=Phaeocystidibacter marisrubri TaxID=1577780 RepID=A0A6L3ZGK6_9FLAO|nr:M23 family metallopeptidase [Phaeocystidibacter marisrubri]KAB2816967.1 M23 family metallopeptidase [Phaeocystidibacter marisrubri]TNE28237.1 MAG: M23 family metallopeptidase [Bacteroidota bacterium]GGH77403.1 peptidase M23 [Phaeocystidibacter marisrubri]